MNKTMYRQVFDLVRRLPNDQLFTIYLICKDNMVEIEKDFIPKTKCTSVRRLLQFLLTGYLCKHSRQRQLGDGIGSGPPD